MRHRFSDDLGFLCEHYSGLMRQHGDTPAAAQWSDRDTQEQRMAVLAEVGDLRDAKLLDFGCGTGHLLEFLQNRGGFTGEYVGYDLSPDLLEAARAKHPRVRFEQRDILAEPLTEDFDYVLVNGVFNNLVGDNWARMTTLLKTLFDRTRKALAFNALSKYVDFFDPGLFYVSPEELFRFCKQELSPCVALRHDYLVKPGVVPFEFAVFVYVTDLRPRTRLST